MIRSFRLQNYRGFREYQINDLSRVNLLVGMNNSGKTSVLEAVQYLASGGDPRILSEIASLRGEEIFFDDEFISSLRYRRRNPAFPDISHFFHGHAIHPGDFFRISSTNSFNEITATIIETRELDERQLQLFREVESLTELGVEFQIGSDVKFVLPVTEDGALFSDTDQAFRMSRRFLGELHTRSVSTLFVTSKSLEPLSMSEMWDKVVLEGQEDDVINAMRILEPNLDNIVFLSGEQRRTSRSRGGVLVGFRDTKRRVPLGSFGDGMRRLLALSLSLIQARGGVLLIDEIDTGLHWSIMDQMWMLIIETARKNDIQIFATTHSLDCLRGLASLLEHHDDYRNQVSLQKIDVNLPESVSLNAEEILVAAEHEIEVR